MAANEIEILLIEDNPSDVELTLHALRQHKLANQIHVARDGEEALDFIFCCGKFSKHSFNSPPKLILLDLGLPKVDGLEVLRAIKSDSRTKHIPVVILTSSREDQHRIDSYNLGVNSYIQKPVDFDQFKTAMRTIGMYWLLLNRPPVQR
jgi:two-component system, response regulator